MEKLQELEEYLEKNSKITDDEEAIKDFEEQAKKFSINQIPEEDESEFEEQDIPVVESRRQLIDDFEIYHNIFVDNSASTWQYAKKVDIIKPYNLRGTANAVRYAEQRQKKIRGLGSRHSFSLAPSTDDYYVVLDKTFKYSTATHNEDVKNLDQDSLDLIKSGYDKEKYFDVPCGMSISDINDVLCPDNPNLKPIGGTRRSMFNMGGGDVQTFAGAFSTGTHGSGGKHSAYHDTIRSLVLVASKGEIYRLEPKDGITDPAKYEAYYNENPGLTKPKLIQNNDLFYSSLVSMGCFGIMYSAIIEVQEMKLLHEDAYYHKGQKKGDAWNEEFKKNFKKPFLPDPEEEEEFFYIQLNPYKLKKNREHSLLIKKIKPTVIPGSGKQVTQRKFWPSVFANSGFAVNVIRTIANAGKFPKRRFIEQAISAQNDHDGEGGGYTDITYKVWNAGSGKLKSFGTAIEFAFPVHRVPAVLDLLFAFLDQSGDMGMGYYFNAPIALRFVRAGKAYLAPNYEVSGDGKKVKEWCYIEILRVNSKNVNDDQKELELFHHIQRMFTAMGGRPHWGLNFNFEFSVEYLQKTYPKFNPWLKAYQKFNSTGVFENGLTRSMRIS
ncbi:MAG: D-arabinono-1,4-lactone oxidase [Bacteroidota bacterium]